MNSNILKFLFVVTIIKFGSAALPSNIRVCARNDPNFAECFKNTMESLKPVIKTGKIAQGFEIDGLDPLTIGDVAVSRGFDLKLFGLQVFGFSNFKIEKLRVNVDKIKFEFILSVPKISTKSKYNLSWKLAVLNLQGKGDVQAHLDNVKVLLKFGGSRYTKNGSSYIKIETCRIEVKPGSVRVRFENLFNGQKDLEEAGNQVINQNINMLLQDMLPPIERGIEKKILKGANSFFSKGTEYELFPVV